MGAAAAAEEARLTDHPDAARDGTRFAVLNETLIIAQLARARLEATMPDGLLLPHFAVLNHLVRLGDDKALSRLAVAFQVTKGTITNTVQRLERAGYVEVRPDPKDGRGKRVFLTARGRAMREAAVASLRPLTARLGEELGDGLFEELLPRLARLRRTLDEMRNADPAP